jgi:hypothetical protein
VLLLTEAQIEIEEPEKSRTRNIGVRKAASKFC